MHNHAIASGSGDLKSVLLCPNVDRVIVLSAGAESFRELFHRQEVAIRRVGAVIEIVQELLQLWLVAVLQNEDEIHLLICGKMSHEWGGVAGNLIPRMTRHEGLGLRLANGIQNCCK